jgi:PAS domain-containing protein
MNTISKVIAKGAAGRRKREDEALRQSQAFLSALVESTRDMVWSVDAKTFRLLTFNSALRDYFTRVFSVDLREGMSVGEVLPPDRRTVWLDFYSRVIAEGPFRIEYELFAGAGHLDLAFNRSGTKTSNA